MDHERPDLQTPTRGGAPPPHGGPSNWSTKRIVIWSLALVGADLALKVWSSSALRAKSIDLPGPVDLQLGYNSGVAFGRLGDAPPAAIIGVTFVITVGLWVAAARGALPTFPAVLIASGATANVLDRFEAGSVVDMFHTGWWPTFNLADIYITGGAILLVLVSLRAGPADPAPNADL